MTAADILRNAAVLLEEQGWRQDDAGRVGEPRCVLGALREACLPESPGIAHAEAAARLRAIIGGDLIQWNDSPVRTADEVIAALRAAAGDAQ